MNDRLRRGLVLALALALAAGCGSAANGHGARKPPPGVKLIGTARAAAPPSAASLRAAAQGEETFGVSLYRELAAGNGNFAIAPSSIATVLGMIGAGARGATARQIVEAMRVPLPAAEQSAAIGGLARSFAARSGNGVTLDEVDQAWLPQGLSILTPYADTLAGPFGAPLATIDFNPPDAAATTINKWFAENTHGKITKLLEGSDLDQAALVLTDAVYLDAQWAHGFDRKRTAPAPFHLADGGVAQVPTMHLRATVLGAGPQTGYGTGAGWKAVSLPYKGGQLEFDVIVPDDLRSFEASLTGVGLSTMLSSLRPTNIELSMPKFDATTRSDLIPALERLGVQDVFDPNRADLSGIDGKRDLYVRVLKHEVVVHVNERGTVAAGATAGVAVPVSLPRFTAVDVDEPFVYVVRDRRSGAVLFLGRITDPAG